MVGGWGVGGGVGGILIAWVQGGVKGVDRLACSSTHCGRLLPACGAGGNTIENDFCTFNCASRASSLVSQYDGSSCDGFLGRGRGRSAPGPPAAEQRGAATACRHRQPRRLLLLGSAAGDDIKRPLQQCACGRLQALQLWAAMAALARSSLQKPRKKRACADGRDGCCVQGFKGSCDVNSLLRLLS